MPTTALNLSQVADNAANLGKDLFDQLTGGLLSHVQDPAQVDMVSRATATIAATPIAMIGADDATRAQLQNDYDAAQAVLWSLASAAVEDEAGAAEAAKAKLTQLTSDFIQAAVKGVIVALVAA